jgi:hypothetical protein
MRSTTSLTKIISIATIALALVASVAPPSEARGPQETERQLVWESFMSEGGDFDRYRLSDRDVIKKEITIGNVSYRRGRIQIDAVVPRDEVEIVLVSGQNITWWKGITAFKNAPLRRPNTPRENWVRLQHVATQDDEHGPTTMRLKVRDLRDGLMLSFEKAKAFGVHTPMYQFKVPNPSSLGGLRLIFSWERDG